MPNLNFSVIIQKSLNLFKSNISTDNVYYCTYGTIMLQALQPKRVRAIKFFEKNQKNR